MKRAVQHAKAPIFFFQAENDWNLSPSQVLSAVMKAAGKPFEVKNLPAVSPLAARRSLVRLLRIGGMGGRRLSVSEPPLRRTVNSPDNEGS